MLNRTVDVLSAASQHAVAVVNVNVGTCKIGINQSQLDCKETFSSRTLPNLRRIIDLMIGIGELHLLNLCDLGCHRQGLQSANMQIDDLIDEALSPGNLDGFSQGEYAAIYDIGPADEAKVALHKQWTEEFTLKHSVALDAVLVLTCYRVTTGALQPAAGLLFCGQLHIRTPTRQRRPGIATRKLLVKEAMGIITYYAPTNRADGKISVAVLCGDVNLTQDDADACCQIDIGGPNVATGWRTASSIEGLPGDVMFVRGSVRVSCDFGIGTSYFDRGIGNADNDAFFVTIVVPLYGRKLL